MAGPVNVNSRGDSISAYSPAFSKGGKIYADNMKAAYLSGTLVSGKTTRAIAHGLGAKPKFVIVSPLPTLAQGISASRIDINVAAASAATSTNIYVIGTQPANAALKYIAYVQL